MMNCRLRNLTDNQINTPTLRPATARDAFQLTALSLRSKSHWGYSDEFIEACRSELSISADQINRENSNFIVAEICDQIVGYCCVMHQRWDAHFELDALFVDPPYMGRGIGRRLLTCALDKVNELGGTILVIQSDPNAEDFYRSFGGRLTGTRESGSIPGRHLPVFEIDIDTVKKAK